MAERERWPGGHVHVGADGRRTYIIRRRVGGRRHEVSTRCSSLRAAMKELERWESDPAGYQPGGVQGPEPVRLTDALALAFLAWSKEKGNSEKYRKGQHRVLVWWQRAIGDTDLRTCGGGPIKAALVGAPARQLRIATIKAFCAWLVKEREILTLAEDPTATLSVPQSTPEQWRREKVIPRADYLRVREVLANQWRDALDVLAGTGWHLTELERFSEAGEILPAQREGEAAILLCPRAKSGRPHRTAVSEGVKAAAERVRERGGMRGDSLFHAVAKACAHAKVPQIRPGSFRHSVATWAIEAGADPAAVATFLGHTSPATTARFYATHAAPKKVPTLR